MVEKAKRVSPNGQDGLVAVEAQRRVHLTRISGMELKAGDKIEGVVTLTDLDVLVDLLAVKLSGRTLNRRKPGQITTPKLLSRYFVEDARKEGFFGTFRGFDITILGNSQEEKTLAFETIGNAHSTGKPSIAGANRRNSLSVDNSGNPILDSTFVDRAEFRRKIAQIRMYSQLGAVLAEVHLTAQARRAR